MNQDEARTKCPLCETPGALMLAGPPVRIDTLRNRASATIALLELLLAQADELHGMAYERAGHRGEERVTGGSRDFALDTHGDPKARAALRALNRTTIACAELASTASHDALRILTEGRPPTTGPRTAKAAELGEAIMAQARRVQDGSFVPYRGMPQPGVDTALRAAEQDKARLQKQVTKLEKRVAKVATLAEQEAIAEARELRKQNKRLRELLGLDDEQQAS